MAPRDNTTPNIDRKHADQARRLHRQYLCGESKFRDEVFQRRCRISRAIFDKIAASVCKNYTYFVKRFKCSGKAGISPQVNVTAALRTMAYGIHPDGIEDYLEMA